MTKINDDLDDGLVHERDNDGRDDGLNAYEGPDVSVMITMPLLRSR